ncbi:MAG: HxsD-like protein [Lachnospiraceae bacterium]|nr:HxsD-like protein [Lachnospiraceae bacterium]
MNKLYLNRKIYDKKFILQAIADFSQLALIQLSEKKEYWVCSFKNCKVSTNRTINEFENYLIGLSNREGF